MSVEGQIEMFNEPLAPPPKPSPMTKAEQRKADREVIERRLNFHPDNLIFPQRKRC